MIVELQRGCVYGFICLLRSYLDRFFPRRCEGVYRLCVLVAWAALQFSSSTCSCLANMLLSRNRADLFFRKADIQWECDNGGQLWTPSAQAGYGGTTPIPAGFCTSGFANLDAAFIVGLLVDLVSQVSV